MVDNTPTIGNESSIELSSLGFPNSGFASPLVRGFPSLSKFESDTLWSSDDANINRTNTSDFTQPGFVFSEEIEPTQGNLAVTDLKETEDKLILINSPVVLENQGEGSIIGPIPGSREMMAMDKETREMLRTVGSRELTLDNYVEIVGEEAEDPESSLVGEVMALQNGSPSVSEEVILQVIGGDVEYSVKDQNLIRITNVSAGLLIDTETGEELNLDGSKDNSNVIFNDGVMYTFGLESVDKVEYDGDGFIEGTEETIASIGDRELSGRGERFYDKGIVSPRDYVTGASEEVTGSLTRINTRARNEYWSINWEISQFSNNSAEFIRTTRNVITYYRNDGGEEYIAGVDTAGEGDMEI